MRAYSTYKKKSNARVCFPEEGALREKAPKTQDLRSMNEPQRFSATHLWGH